ncbi:hypothetical protein PAERUG_E16_London_17_VIM_2_04_14_02062 [Pseudomonas aeruginosa]|nr:hypothetical protein PAERUG_E16_London_17_VIM_2_04_14_02062 [Pseudomonas aeruginosa]
MHFSSSSLEKCIGTPHSLGNSDSGQRAVACALRSSMATGRMPARRQLITADRLTSSVPTISGRSNGFRPCRWR